MNEEQYSMRKEMLHELDILEDIVVHGKLFIILPVKDIDDYNKQIKLRDNNKENSI